MAKPRDDYELVHQEYIYSGLSLRQLAKKHNVSVATIQRWKNKGGWDAQRKNAVQEALWEAGIDTHINTFGELAERMERVMTATDKLLEKVSQLLELEGALAPRDIKSLSSVLLDVVQIHALGRKDESEEVKDQVVIRIEGGEDYA